MTPIRSNLNKESCSPISSNCVIWQGPDLLCINLCTGDTISDVVYKLAVELCSLKDQLNLSDLDLKCLVDACITCPEPEKMLGTVLQLLIDKVCDLSDIIAGLGLGGNNEVEVRLASCFIADFTDSNGDITNPVPVSTYVQKIAQKVCAILTRLDGIDASITGLETGVIDLDGRVTILENKGNVQVIPICSSSSTLKDINVAFNGLEQSFCNLRTVTGLPGDLSLVLNEECKAIPPSNVIFSLLTPGQSLWTDGSSNTIADTLTHMWKAICDLRGAVKLIQDTCCSITCDDLRVDFDIVVKYDEPGQTYYLLFFLGQKTNIPVAFHDCDMALGQVIGITDGAGRTNTVYLPIREILDDPGYLMDGYRVDLPANLDPTAGTMLIDTNICITDGTLNCIKCLHKELPYSKIPCPYCVITACGPTTLTIRMCGDVTTVCTP